MILPTPIFLIKNDIPTYISPAIIIPPWAYAKSPYISLTVNITGMKAKDEPRKTGTLPWVHR